MVYWASIQGGLYFALRWMHVGGFMVLAGEMTALISHVRLRVSPPLLVVPGLSRVAPIISILFKIAL